MLSWFPKCIGEDYHPAQANSQKYNIPSRSTWFPNIGDVRRYFRIAYHRPSYATGIPSTWKRQAYRRDGRCVLWRQAEWPDRGVDQRAACQDWEIGDGERYFVRSAEAMRLAKERAIIERDHPELSISQQCRPVELSRSAIYYTLAMMKEIDRVFTKYPFFGSRQIASNLERDGTVVGRHRFRRLMTTMGLEAIFNRSQTSRSPISLGPLAFHWLTICSTGSIHVCCEACRSTAPIKFGALISRSCLSKTAS